VEEGAVLPLGEVKVDVVEEVVEDHLPSEEEEMMLQRQTALVPVPMFRRRWKRQQFTPQSVQIIMSNLLSLLLNQQNLRQSRAPLCGEVA
jgi:hypothetical protein